MTALAISFLDTKLHLVLHLNESTFRPFRQHIFIEHLLSELGTYKTSQGVDVSENEDREERINTVSELCNIFTEATEK